ncbi:MAG TPA: hypothetical protein VHA56_11930 [Mucilaginibacter sp.]|nr:hypothetical protein [Mucilaginibacter sp.]
MKNLFLLIIVSVVLWGCSTQNDVQPQSADSTQTSVTTPADPATPGKLNWDDTIHMVAFVIFPQKVKTSVSGTTLNMTFDENVNLFVLAEGYKVTSAVHLKEDFKKTGLAGFDFTTVNQDGQTTFNSIDDNLNNVKFKTIGDTVINGVKAVKINIHRQLVFSKTYASAQLATDQQNLMLGRYEDVVSFSSYTYYNQKNYPVTSAVAYVVYEK